MQIFLQFAYFYFERYLEMSDKCSVLPTSSVLIFQLHIINLVSGQREIENNSRGGFPFLWLTTGKGQAFG